MERATATLNNHRQSPRKVRILTGLVRGKPVAAALNSLMFAEKKAAAPVKKLIESALASAKKRGNGH
jgi:large subunit ribosomal protein L22